MLLCDVWNNFNPVMGTLTRALLTLIRERDFVKTRLNANGDGVFIVLLAQAFVSDLLADFARLKRKK